MYGNGIVSVSVYDKHGVFISVDEVLLDILGLKKIFSIDDVIEKNIYRHNNRLYVKKVFNNEKNFLVLFDITDELVLSLSPSPLPIMWVNKNGDIVFANAATNSKLGFDDITTYQIYRLSSDIYMEDWQRLWRLVSMKNIEFNHNFYNKMSDKLLSLKISCNYISEYDVCQMIITDLTSITHINNRLLRNKHYDDESERLINSFLSNISHEVRTPMNAIIGYSSILSDRVDSILKEYTDIICQNTERLLVLFENIISMSKIDSNTVMVNNSTFNIQDIFKYMMSVYNNKINMSKKDVRIVIDDITHLYLNTDKYIVEECIHKLMDNAVKFTEKGEIHLGYVKNGYNIRIYVKDTGIGVRDEFLPFIFNRFYKVDRWCLGTGLGLAIFKSYVKILGGRYDVKSDVTKGSEFGFTFKI